MKLGTKSVLFGAHQFAIHPWFVAAAWWKLFGFPWDPRLWVAFFVHDIGYIGKPNMDGPEGESHPWMGAKIMSFLFTRPLFSRLYPSPNKWGDFCLYHSRFLAKSHGRTPSRLCIADKLAICLQPAWLYLPAVRATGEIREYMRLAMAMNEQDAAKYSTMNLRTESELIWYRDVQDYVRRWVEEHKDGRTDTWTPAAKVANSESGVWK
jgi:hypothetical protein